VAISPRPSVLETSRLLHFWLIQPSHSRTRASTPVVESKRAPSKFTFRFLMALYTIPSRLFSLSVREQNGFLNPFHTLGHPFSTSFVLDLLYSKDRPLLYRFVHMNLRGQHARSNRRARPPKYLPIHSQDDDTAFFQPNWQ